MFKAFSYPTSDALVATQIAKTIAQILALTDIFKEMYGKYFVVVCVAKNEEEFEENIQEMAVQTEDKIKNLIMFLDWPNLKIIPPPFSDEGVFMEIRCKITGKAIRHVVQPIKNHGVEDMILYERDQIELYLKTGENPPSWPTSLMFTRLNIEPNYGLQHKINKHGEDLRNSAKKAYADIEEFLSKTKQET